MKGRWIRGTYVVGGAVVGTVTEDAFGRGWWAHICEIEWEDVKLGKYPSQEKAESAVESWVTAWGM
jgi:hypothetical protein